MAYTTYDTLAEFFGPGYSVASNEIKLNTNEHAGGTVGTFTVDAGTDVITATAHGLQVGHRVKVSSSTTLPAGLTAGVSYYVLTTPDANSLTLSLTSGGTVVDITDTGTGTHTMVAAPLLTYLTNAQAADSTAQTVFAILDAINEKYKTIPTADKPTKFSITRSGYTDETTGELVYNYSATCRVNPTGFVAVNS